MISMLQHNSFWDKKLPEFVFERSRIVSKNKSHNYCSYSFYLLCTNKSWAQNPSVDADTQPLSELNIKLKWIFSNSF